MCFSTLLAQRKSCTPQMARNTYESTGFWAPSNQHTMEMHLLIVCSMADLIGFDGYLNTTTPFEPKEHEAQWKSNQTYLDFSFDNTYNETCEYPRFWNDSGNLVLKDSSSTFSELVGCYDSEFDQVSTQPRGGKGSHELTALSTATPRPLVSSLTGSDSFRNSHRSRIAFASGCLLSAKRSSTSCAWSLLSWTSTASASTKPHR